MNVNEVIETIINSCYTGKRFEHTCDIIAAGNGEQTVTGIVTSFMATVDVINEAIRIGANLIITHEPTYFNGADKVEWLKDDVVFKQKKKLLEDHNISVWRFHDYMHMAKTDMIYDGLKQKLGWENYQVSTSNPWIYDIPKVKLQELVDFLKSKIGMPNIRIIGDLNNEVARVGILVGGGSLGLGKEEMPIELMMNEQIDVMLCGEVVEWTLCAYVNDAKMLGLNKNMIILGHERSEEWGMSYLAEWCKDKIIGIPVQFVDAKEPFTYC